MLLVPCLQVSATPGQNIVYWKVTVKGCDYRRLSNKIMQPGCQYKHVYYCQEPSEPWCRGLQVSQVIPGILFIDGVLLLPIGLNWLRHSGCWEKIPYKKDTHQGLLRT